MIDKSNIEKAVSLLNADKIVAIPTETVYGLAANIFSDQAIATIFELKKRPLYNPLIVHIKSLDDLSRVVSEIPEKAWLLAKAFWPGPLTLVLKKQDNISDLVTAGKTTVAVRVPNHPLALELLQRLDFPLAAPSANPFGAISPTTARHVSTYFEPILVPVLDGGACEKGIESTIIGFEDNQPVLYRAGATPIESIESIVGVLKIVTKADVAPVAPGMLTKHYAPVTPTVYTSDVASEVLTYQHKKIGVLAFSKWYEHSAIAHQEVLSETGDLNMAATRLYAVLHALDAQSLDVIIVEKVPHEGLGIAINDKLQRAAAQ